MHKSEMGGLSLATASADAWGGGAQVKTSNGNHLSKTRESRGYFRKLSGVPEENSGKRSPG